MNRVRPELVAREGRQVLPEGAMATGQLLNLDECGRPMVTAPSVGLCTPVPARSAVARPAGWEPGQALAVVLHFEDKDPARPIIVGIVRDSFEPASAPLLDLPLSPLGVSMDGKRLQLEASQEVVLKCGQGSITLQADGRVVIKGTELVSRASGTNKIRGASVAIN